jgi:hypothetical protein
MRGLDKGAVGQAGNQVRELDGTGAGGKGLEERAVVEPVALIKAMRKGAPAAARLRHRQEGYRRLASQGAQN